MSRFQRHSRQIMPSSVSHIDLLHPHTELSLRNFTHYWVMTGDKRCSAILNLWWKPHSVQLTDGKISFFNLFPPTSKYQVPIGVFGLSSVITILPPPSPSLLKTFLQHRSYSIFWRECCSCANSRTRWPCSLCKGTFLCLSWCECVRRQTPKAQLQTEQLESLHFVKKQTAEVVNFHLSEGI